MCIVTPDMPVEPKEQHKPTWRKLEWWRPYLVGFLLIAIPIALLLFLRAFT